MFPGGLHGGYLVDSNFFAQCFLNIIMKCNATSLFCLIQFMGSSQEQKQKGLTGYCFKYIDRPFCLRANGSLCIILDISELEFSENWDCLRLIHCLIKSMIQCTGSYCSAEFSKTFV